MIDTLGINRRFYGNRIGNGLEVFRNKLRNPLAEAIILALFGNGEQGGYFKIGNPQWRRNVLIWTSDAGNEVWAFSANVSAVYSSDTIGQFEGSTLITEQPSDIVTQYSIGQGVGRLDYNKTFSRSWYLIDEGARYVAVTSRAVGATFGEYAIIDLQEGMFVSSTDSKFNQSQIRVTKLSNNVVRIDQINILPQSSGSRSTIGLHIASPDGTTIEYISGVGGRAVRIVGVQGELTPEPTDYQRITDGTTELQEKFPLAGDNLYTTSAGDTQAVVGDPVGLVNPLAGQGVTTTSPISAERPILRETPDGVRYLEFLSTSRVTFDFGSPFVGAMWVSTLGGSYVVEIDTTSTFVWGQFMPVREVTGIVFVESYDIESNQAETVRQALTTVTGGQLDWDDSLDNFSNAFRINRLTSIPVGLFDSTHNSANFSNMFLQNQLTEIPVGLFDNTPNIITFQSAFRDNHITTVPTGLFDNQTVCTNYLDIFVGQNALTPQSVENVLVSIAFSANTNGLDNGSLGIRGDESPLTPAAENARQQLLARGWDLTLDNIAGL